MTWLGLRKLPRPTPFVTCSLSLVLGACRLALRSPNGVELVAPRGGFAGVTRGFVELDEALEGCGKPLRLDLLGDARLAFLHASVSRKEQRLGFGELLLAEEHRPEHRFGVERRPVIGKGLLADGETLAQDRLGCVPSLQIEQGLAGHGELSGQFGTFLGQRGTARIENLAEQGDRLVGLFPGIRSIRTSRRSVARCGLRAAYEKRPRRNGVQEVESSNLFAPTSQRAYVLQEIRDGREHALRPSRRLRGRSTRLVLSLRDESRNSSGADDRGATAPAARCRS